MILYVPNSGSVCLSHNTCNPKLHSSASLGIPCLPRKFVFQCSARNCALNRTSISCSLKGLKLPRLSSASSPLLSGDSGSLSHTIPKLIKRRQLFLSARALKDVRYSYRYHAMTKKPMWWWRTLACLPYLMPLWHTWMYAETAFHLQ